MATTISNRAAWTNKPDPAGKFDIREAATGTPEANEVLVKVHAWAINPIDWKLASFPIFPWLQYPVIVGCDVAGEVVQVGSGLSGKYKPGDRVIGLPVGSTNGRHTAGGFQEYCLLEENLMCKMPDGLSYADGSTLPLALTTAAGALFEKGFLGLQLPSATPAPTGKTVLIWGASSSVGSNAVQLAVAAGYTVLATGSPKNFDQIKALGAGQVFDYNSPSVVPDIVEAIKNTDFAGSMLAAGELEPVLQVAKAAPGSKFVASSREVKGELPEGVESKMVFGGTIRNNEVGPAIWGEFVPQALGRGAYQIAPKAQVVGKGLESIQEACDILKKGVSARKLVVEL